MQGRNKTESTTPKSGDGTQDVKKSQTDANWYGASQEPQEEFIEGDRKVADSNSTKMSGSDEGTPTFSGTKQPGTPERAVESDREQKGRGFKDEPSDIDNRH